jgi:hypothetical protein
VGFAKKAGLIFLAVCILSLPGKAQKKGLMSAFKDSTDGALDISDWLVSKKGFLLIPTLITEPAVGYGIGGAAVFFHDSYSAKKGPPSMTGVLGGITENGTWAAGVFHAGFWKNDRIRYMGAAAKLYANIGFYGSGNLDLLGEEPVNLNLDSWFLLQQIKFRIGNTNLFAGGKYMLLKTDNTFEVPIDIPDFEGKEFSATLSEATIKMELDSRDNIFTPNRGAFIGLSGTYSDEWMGGQSLYGRLGVIMIGYIPASDKITLGVRHESIYSFGDVPFWARPIIYMRGVPLMKYQNRNTSLLEAELSWNVYRRWYLSGFTGMGTAFENYDSFDKGKSVTTIGTGFRYKIARKLGTNMGLDFAFSNDDFGVYIIFGTAWLR